MRILRFLLPASVVVAAFLCGPVFHARGVAPGDAPVQLTARVDRVFTDQLFTLNDGHPGHDLPVFIPNPLAPPRHGDRVTVSGSMRRFDWTRWVDNQTWFDEGWGLMHDMLVKFENRPVLVADSVFEPGGRNLALPEGQVAPPGPVQPQTRGERKAARQAEKAWTSTHGMTTAAAVGTAAGYGHMDAGPVERMTPAGDQPDRQTGEGAGTSAPGAPTAGAAPAAPDTPMRQGMGPTTISAARTMSPDDRFATTDQVVADPDAYAGQDLVVSGTVVRLIGKATVELGSGDGQVLTVELDAEPAYLVAGQRVLVHGRLMPHSGPAAMMSGHLLSPTGASAIEAGSPEVTELDADVVVATPHAIAGDPALFVGRKVNIVATVANIAGAHAFVVRDDISETSSRATTSLNDAVVVLVSDPSQLPQEPGMRVRVVGRVVMLPEDPAAQPADAAERIDPAWLEGLDMSLYAGQPTIVAETVTEPGLRQIGR
ncbi:MAG: hypothetical protein ACREAA_06435 [Candidatus Polarisedimenticolia bacterium]